MLRQLVFSQRRLISCASVLRAEGAGSVSSSRSKRRTSKNSTSNKLHNVSLPFEVNDASNPRKISEYLDEYVIGQDRAKRALAVAVFNHYARVRSILRHSEELDEYSRFLEAEFRRRYDNDNTDAHDINITALSPEGQEQQPQSSDKSNAPPNETNNRPVATKKKSTSSFDFDFISSGPPSSLSPSTSSRNNDPTQYAHDSLLTDFVGQVSGSTSSSNSGLDMNTISFPQKPSPDPMIHVEKSNILLVGPTGTGKTLLARTLAKCLDVPFVSVEATPFTQAGYVGEDVESCVQRLVQAAGYDLKKAAVGIIHIDEIDKLSRKQSDGNSKDVSGEGVQQSLLRILEGSMVQVTDKGFSGGMTNTGGNGKNPLKDGGLPHSPMSNGNVSSGGNGGGGGKGETYLLDTSNILFILSGAFVGIEKVIRDRIAKGSIGFNAPLKTDSLRKDKDTRKAISDGDSSLSFSQSSQSSALSHFFTTNTPESIFPQLEPVDLINYGLIPEFVGRLPMLTTLNSLSEADLLRVLTAPRQALLKQYEALFAYYGVELMFTRPALLAIASLAKKHQTGARGLRRIMENVLLDPMYTSPQSSIRYVLIDKSVVEGKSHAKYYSRGQQTLFNTAAMEDEQMYPEAVTLASQVLGPSNNDSSSSSSKDSSRLQSAAA